MANPRLAAGNFESSRPRQAGFSLLETLVAFFILAMVLSVIYESAGTSVNATVSDERRSYALLLAQSVLDNYKGIPAGGLSQSGRLENGYAWQMTATPRASDEANPNPWPLFDVQVLVSWGNPVRTERLETVLPQWTAGAP